MQIYVLLEFYGTSLIGQLVANWPWDPNITVLQVDKSFKFCMIFQIERAVLWGLKSKTERLLIKVSGKGAVRPLR